MKRVSFQNFTYISILQIYFTKPFMYLGLEVVLSTYKVVDVTGETPRTINVGGQLSVKLVKASKYFT